MRRYSLSLFLSLQREGREKERQHVDLYCFHPKTGVSQIVKASQGITMTLNAYLLKRGITSEQFAKKVRVSLSSVNKWRMKGYRIPRAAMIRKIEKTTKGSVTLKDWYH